MSDAERGELTDPEAEIAHGRLDGFQVDGPEITQTRLTEAQITDDATTTETGGKRRLFGRATWMLVDQAISSGTNAGLSFVVARSVDTETFGGFAVAFTVFALLVGLCRALSTSPLGIRFADVGVGAYRDAASAASGNSLALGAVGGVISVVVGLFLPGPAGAAILALGVVLPALLVQDAWRYVFFSAGRPAAAALNDAVWAVVQFAAVIALLELHISAVAPLVLAWGLAAAAAALLGVRQARAIPRPRHAWRWLVDHRDITGYLAAEWGTLQGGRQGALLIVAAVGSLTAVGSLRGVEVLMGPIAILGVATIAFAVPELARRRTTFDSRRWRQMAVLVGVTVAFIGLVWGLAFILLPDVVGQTLLGDTWPGAREILWPTVIGQFGGALGIGPTVVLLALERASVTFSVNVLQAPLMLIGGTLGVVLAGAYGAAIGLAIPFWVGLPLLCWRLYRETHPSSATIAAASR